MKNEDIFKDYEDGIINFDAMITAVQNNTRAEARKEALQEAIAVVEKFRSPDYAVGELITEIEKQIRALQSHE